MKNRTLLTTLGLGVLLASCNSSRYTYNDGFEDDELYYTSNDPEEYDLSAYEVVESSTANNQEYEDDYYSGENGGYDDGADTYVTNNYYGNSNNWNSNPYNSFPYYSNPSYGYNNYGSGWNVGWNSWSGWNLNYNWGWGNQQYNPYNPWGHNYYNPWQSPYYGSCWNNPFYGGYAPYYNYGNFNGYTNNDYAFNGSNQFFGHSSSLSSNSMFNSQYSQGTILTQASERNIVLGEVSSSQVTQKPQAHNTVMSSGSSKPELLASTVANKPQIITSRTNESKVTGESYSGNNESRSQLGGDYQWKPNGNSPERSNNRKPVYSPTRTKPHANWSSSQQRTNPSHNREREQNDSWNQRNSQSNKGGQNWQKNNTPSQKNRDRSNYGGSDNNRRDNTPSYGGRSSSRNSSGRSSSPSSSNKRR